MACKDSKLIPTMANGRPAFAQYRCNPDGSGHHAWAIQVIDISGDKISAINTFLDVERIFPSFGLPLSLAA
jgi:RNA polymerase sigma-70 factor (ECF subfamily)